jgi:hypothetical protein
VLIFSVFVLGSLVEFVPLGLLPWLSFGFCFSRPAAFSHLALAFFHPHGEFSFRSLCSAVYVFLSAVDVHALH